MLGVVLAAPTPELLRAAVLAAALPLLVLRPPGSPPLLRWPWAFFLPLLFPQLGCRCRVHGSW